MPLIEQCLLTSSQLANIFNNHCIQFQGKEILRTCMQDFNLVNVEV